MKKLFLFTLLILSFVSVSAQKRKYSTFYEQRASLFELLPTTSKDIIFLGNSITNGCEWAELFNNPHVKNRGISGDICEGVYDRLDPIVKGKPAKLFLLIGINDVSRGTSADTIALGIKRIIEKVQSASPRTKIYLQSVLPVSNEYNMFSTHTSRGNVVLEINSRLVKLAKEKKITYIDLYSHFVNKETGKLRSDLSNDGLHMLGKGYMLWRDLVKQYVK
ncbi:GDSL-type esterase/lipase family protein [Bacteroides sedimenti]